MEGKRKKEEDNCCNNEITEAEVKVILQTYGLPAVVHNMHVYRRAFVHRSYLKPQPSQTSQEPIKQQQQQQQQRQNDQSIRIPLKSKANERLEYLGDGILEFVMKFYLYKRFPNENEGFMTEKKIALVCNENLGKLAMEMNLHKYLLLSKHAEEKKIRTNFKKLGCLFEAFIAAVFLDFNKMPFVDDKNMFDSLFRMGPGIQMAQLLIENIFERHIDWTDLIQKDDNFKNILQVRIQKEFKTTPCYIERGHSSETGYNMAVYIEVPNGGGKSGTLPKKGKCVPQWIYLSDIRDKPSLQRAMEGEQGMMLCLGEGKHKIKRKAEQYACFIALKAFEIIDRV